MAKKTMPKGMKATKGKAAPKGSMAAAMPKFRPLAKGKKSVC
jgi:hypothetical protein